MLPRATSLHRSLNLVPLWLAGLGSIVAPAHGVWAVEPGQPVVARVEMQFTSGEDVIDQIAKGDLLTVVEDRGDDYIIVTHEGTRGTLDKVNAVTLAESTDIYTELIKEYPDQGRFHTLRASAWWALGDNDRALKDFDEAIGKGYEQANAYSSRGLFHAEAGNAEQAIKDFDKALKLDPDDISPLINRAAVWMSTAKFDKAIADYTAALKSRPDDVRLLRQRAIARKAAGQLDAAIEDFDAILDLDPANVAAIKGRGFVRFQKQDFAGAAADFSAALELEPNDPESLNNRGYNRNQAGRAADALADYDAAIGLAPQYALAHQNRAWLLATAEDESLRDPKEAVASAKRAAEINDYVDIGDLAALAAASAAAGKFDEAVGWQEKVVEIAGDRIKIFAQKNLDRYRRGRPFSNDPDAADATEKRSAETAAERTARLRNEAARKKASAAP